MKEKGLKRLEETIGEYLLDFGQEKLSQIGRKKHKP